MLPLEHGLDRRQASVSQRNDRLVVKHQLAVLGGVTELCFELEPLHGALAHIRVEDFVARLPAGFGAVHRHVRLA